MTLLRKNALAVLAALVVVAGAPRGPAAAFDSASAPEALLVRAGRIYVLGKTDYVEDAWMVVRDGKIERIGVGPAPEDFDLRTVDFGPAAIVPGLVSMQSRLFTGRDEDGLGARYVAADKFNPYADFGRAWRYGVTSARLAPPGDRFVGGIGSVVRFGGDPETAQVLVERYDLLLNFNEEAGRGEPPIGTIRTPTSADVPYVPAEQRRPETRLGRLAALESLIRDAEATRAASGDEVDLRLDAFRRFLESARPMRLDARRDVDILQAVEAAKRSGRSAYLSGLTEGHLVADRLFEARLPVVVEIDNDLADLASGGFDTVRPLRSEESTAAVLEARGLEVVLDGRTEDLLLAAALAVRGGMKAGTALRAVTERPARLLGIGDRTGRLAAGMDADFAVVNGDPLSSTSHVQETWVLGRRAWSRSPAGPRAERRREKDAVVVKAGRVYDGKGNVWIDGEVLIEDGRIVACGRGVPRPRRARIHDAGADAVVTPGFVDVQGFLGLEADRSSVAPSFPLHEVFAVARPTFEPVARAGITTVVVAPRTAGTSGSPMVAVKTAGEGREDLVSEELVGLKIAVRGNAQTAEKNLEGLVAKAEAYHRKWVEYEEQLAKFEAAQKGDAAPAEAAAPAAEQKKPEEPAEKSEGKGSDDEAVDALSGTWKVKLSGGPIPEPVETPMKLALEDGRVSGTIADPLGGGDDAVITGTFDGKTLEAEVEAEDSPFGNPKITATMDKPEHLVGKVSIGGIVEIDLEADRTEKKRPTITVSRRRAGPSATAAPAKGPKKPKLDPNLEPFRGILSGKGGVALEADGYHPVKAALSVFSKRKIPVVIIGGQDVHRLLDEVPEDLVGVAWSGGLIRIDDRVEVVIPEELERAGVVPLFASGGTWEASRLPRLARGAVREGLGADQALRSLTYDAARLLRLEDRIGSLTPGCDGDLLIFDGEPFDVRTRLETVMIRGKEIR